MSNRMKAILLSCVTMLLCVTLMAAGTFALFTDTATVKHHLEAGKLEVSLFRTQLDWTNLTETGIFKTETNTEQIDYTNENTMNVFKPNATTEATKAVPESWYKATMKLTNGGDVAFTYWIEVVIQSTKNELAEQLQITVTPNNGTAVSKEGLEGTIELGKDSGWTVDTKNPEQTFTVEVKFLDKGDASNSAMNDTVDFDIIVHAVQATSSNQ